MTQVSRGLWGIQRRKGSKTLAILEKSILRTEMMGHAQCESLASLITDPTGDSLGLKTIARRLKTVTTGEGSHAFESFPSFNFAVRESDFANNSSPSMNAILLIRFRRLSSTASANTSEVPPAP